MINWNTYDIETFTQNDIVKPFCICGIIENTEFVVYLDNDDIILKSLYKISETSNRSDVTIYIHNINFDGTLILDSLSKNNIFFSTIIKELNIYSISFKYLSINFTFKCSYKLIPLSLKNIETPYFKKKPFPYKFIDIANINYIGDCPSAEYFESEDDYNSFKDKKFDFKKQIIEYCLNDVRLLKSILTDFTETLNKLNPEYIKLFKKSYSIPSLSNKIFYKMFNKSNINKKITLEMNSYLSKSYFGGRCEIFGNIRKDEIIHYFDYSGMYGQCMLQKFPIGEPYFKLDVNSIEKPGFYYIKYISDIDLPVLPYKTNKLLFPNGELEGIYWYEEILEFLKNKGKIIEIKYAILYEIEDFVFKNFVECFNSLRNKGGYYKIIGKLFINSLYGSFGMKKEDTFTIITFSEYEFNEIIKNTNVESYFKLNNCFIIKIIKDFKSKKIFNKNNKKWDDYYHERNVAYSSIISSKARIKLYNAFKDVINEKGRLLYCDTDSIFAAFESNKLGEKCGGDITWSETFDDGMFILPKTYILKNNSKKIIKFKGVNQYNEEFDVLKKEFEKNNIKFSNQITFFKKNMVLKQKLIEKNIVLNKYDKRILSKDLKSSHPIKISHTNNE